MEVERRLRALERAPQLQNSSLTGGKVTALNDAGQRVAEFGKLAGGGYGIAVNDSGSLVTLIGVQDDTGWIAPGLVYPWRKITDGVVVTSPTFVTTYRTNILDLGGNTIVTAVSCFCPAATTGELRLSLPGFGSTANKVLAAGVTTVTQFRWLHGIALGAFSPELNVEVRRTAGAGNIDVFEPDPIAVRSNLLVTGATSGGIFS
ncbi:MAG: hypothetical protein ACKV2O_14730 [Acidimicrobiales bacterium]